MMKNLILILSVVGLFSCGTRERERLTAQVDSLKYELNESQQATQTLGEVGILMDSIDANRQLLRASMVEGTTYSDYVARMTDINNYVRETERKIADLEKTTKKSMSKTNSLSATIKKLRNELAHANKEMESLQALVAQYKSENGNLVQSISLKDTQIAEHEERIRVTQEEMTLLQGQLEEIRIASVQTEAEAYYARAQAVEETANRTKFAPRKKKESRKQALELYKLAYQMGKEEAQPKIEELEKKI
jgi:chromosome segregation ATPase